MKNAPVRLAFLLFLTPLCAPARPAIIRIDVDHVIAAVDPRIYGVFMEPIGIHRADMKFHTLYGPLYDPKSPLADKNGFRTDMIDAARELQLTQMRWPGGNFVASYDWRDGIGPKDKRPKRLELAWGVVEPNQVGTDEWVQLNKRDRHRERRVHQHGHGHARRRPLLGRILQRAGRHLLGGQARRVRPPGALSASSIGASATRSTAHRGSSATRTPTTT